MSGLDMEAVHRRILDRRRANRGLPPYRAALIPEITEVLAGYFARVHPGSSVSGVRRVGGGASKEQFFFTLTGDGEAEQFLLRMDPRRAITETDREREFVLLGAMKGIVPVPEAAWIDAGGEHFPQPAAIMKVVRGVTKPSDAGVKVSGLGTWLGEDLRGKLRDQFVDNLVAIHAYDWRASPLPGFEVPDADPQQAARWSFNYWRELWRIDEGETRPIVALAEQWLASHLPDCPAHDIVVTHGDYRTGNYLFEEDSGRITALLDWELARLGDFHEDLAWVLMQVFGTFDQGTFRASDLYEREDFIAAYEARSGRRVDRRRLHFYDVFSSWKCYVIVAANGIAAARSQHNHQDVLLTFLAATSPMFADDLARLLSQGEPA
ncbi:MAG TPA: phosphotransferase family protein [Novosphingobium sp.]|nr:phosphotransferase family protein [Novosphingobium sp.]HMP55103.1 phosphotransferase family protein [Novosphingobium sp.]